MLPPQVLGPPLATGQQDNYQDKEHDKMMKVDDAEGTDEDLSAPTIVPDSTKGHPQFHVYSGLHLGRQDRVLAKLTSDGCFNISARRLTPRFLELFLLS